MALQPIQWMNINGYTGNVKGQEKKKKLRGQRALPVTSRNPVHGFGLAQVTVFDVLEMKRDLNVHWDVVGKQPKRCQINSN